MPNANGPAWIKRWVTPEVVISALLLALLVLCAVTFNRYGFTYDENNGLIRALNISNYFASGGIDKSALVEIKPENFYGAMADVLGLWLQQLVPALGLDARHLVSGLFGIAGIYYTYRLGEYAGGRWVGVAAAAFLTLMPLWVGYMYFNLKDIPFGATLIASSFYGLKVLSEPARPRWMTLVALALWCGALGTTKLTGVFLLGFAVLVLAGFAMLERGWLPLRTLALRALLCFGLGIIGILVFSIPFWPQLFLLPPGQVITAALKFLNYDGWKNTVMLEGTYFNWNEVPRHYLVTHLLITTPLVTLAFYLLNFPAAVFRRQFALLGASLLPVLFLIIQSITHAQVYGGYRHFLFTLPFICIGAGYGLVTLLRPNGSAVLRFGAIAVFSVSAVWTTVTMVSLFPYQYSAYNLLVGGTPGAEGRYEMDVWRSAEREALQQISDAMPADMEWLRVYACGSSLNFSPFPRLMMASDQADTADFLIWMPRCSQKFPTGFDVVGEVRRQGVLFAAILRAPAAAPGANTAPGAGAASGQGPAPGQVPPEPN